LAFSQLSTASPGRLGKRRTDLPAAPSQPPRSKSNLECDTRISLYSAMSRAVGGAGRRSWPPAGPPTLDRRRSLLEANFRTGFYSFLVCRVAEGTVSWHGTTGRTGGDRHWRRGAESAGRLALLLASEGASVVVADLGVAVDGSGQDSGPANETVAAIAEAGGKAVANSGGHLRPRNCGEPGRLRH